MISNLSSALEVCGFMNSQDFKVNIFDYILIVWQVLI